MREHTVPGGVQIGTPLSVYLRRAYPLCPASVLKDALKKRDCRVNGVRSDGDASVSPGDTIRLFVADEHLTGDLPILYDDGRLLACDKPAGLPVDRDEQGVGEDTVLSRMPGCALCHRLDTGTGGVLLLARDEETLSKVIDAFRRHDLEKNYVCRVLGAPRPAAGDMRDTLARKNGKTVVAREGVPASLSYRVRFSENGESVVDVDLHTGRTHQIRAQFASRGVPLLGDDLYGNRAENKLRHRGRICLHCRRMVIFGQEILSDEPAWARRKER